MLKDAKKRIVMKKLFTEYEEFTYHRDPFDFTRILTNSCHICFYNQIMEEVII